MNEQNNQLTLFTNEQLGVSVRTININGEPYMVGKDVVDALGYKKKYYDVIKQHCYEEDYIFNDGKTQPQNGAEFDYKLLGQRGGYLINESGFYALVFGSDLKQAKDFKRWVTKEVLPSIRKNGAYMTNETINKIETGELDISNLIADLKEYNQQLMLENEELKQQNLALEEYSEQVVQAAEEYEQEVIQYIAAKEEEYNDLEDAYDDLEDAYDELDENYDSLSIQYKEIEEEKNSYLESLYLARSVANNSLMQEFQLEQLRTENELLKQENKRLQSKINKEMNN